MTVPIYNTDLHAIRYLLLYIFNLSNLAWSLLLKYCAFYLIPRTVFCPRSVVWIFSFPIFSLCTYFRCRYEFSVFRPSVRVFWIHLYIGTLCILWQKLAVSLEITTVYRYTVFDIRRRHRSNSYFCLFE